MESKYTPAVVDRAKVPVSTSPNSLEVMAMLCAALVLVTDEASHTASSVSLVWMLRV